MCGNDRTDVLSGESAQFLGVAEETVGDGGVGFVNSGKVFIRAAILVGDIPHVAAKNLYCVMES